MGKYYTRKLSIKLDENNYWIDDACYNNGGADYWMHAHHIKTYLATDDVFYVSTKWSTMNEDMIEYSKKYPNTLFRIQAHDEDFEFRFLQYFFKNGKYIVTGKQIGRAHV